MIIINPIMSGGLPLSKLQAAPATAADVVAGKTFYSGSKTLKTGTRSPGTLREASGTFTFPYNTDAAINVGFQPKYVMLWGFSGERSLVYLCGSGVNDGAAILDRYGQGYGSNGGVSITSTGFKANYRIGSSSISSYFQNTTVNYVAIG